ncbi:helix-turn-helix domain-containing protein [Rothia endophytica]|nr:anaerobic benzoate catabolism transcriptional regulator [Mycobacteroides abscessus subsp. bolletii]HCN39112.1 transcriptional regulator [Rothia sp. (in: high G+C Gram-positive bacteria)]
MGLGQKIKAKRKELRMPQEELAALSGVSERTLRDFERGKLSISLQKALDIAEVLGLELKLVEA